MKSGNANFYEQALIKAVGKESLARERMKTGNIPNGYDALAWRLVQFLFNFGNRPRSNCHSAGILFSSGKHRQCAKRFLLNDIDTAELVLSRVSRPTRSFLARR
jgi:hypothetical protein